MMADAVLLAVQHALLPLGEVAAIHRSHQPLFVAHDPIVTMQPARLKAGNLTSRSREMNARILKRKPVIDLSAPGMAVRPRRRRSGADRRA